MPLAIAFFMYWGNGGPGYEDSLPRQAGLLVHRINWRDASIVELYRYGIEKLEQEKCCRARDLACLLVARTHLERPGHCQSKRSLWTLSPIASA